MHLNALKQLGFENNNLSEAILMKIVLQRINDESRRSFEMTLNYNEIPEWNSFIKFLLKCSQALENISHSVPAKIKTRIYTKTKVLSYKIIKQSV